MPIVAANGGIPLSVFGFILRAPSLNLLIYIIAKMVQSSALVTASVATAAAAIVGKNAPFVFVYNYGDCCYAMQQPIEFTEARGGKSYAHILANADSF